MSEERTSYEYEGLGDGHSMSIHAAAGACAGVFEVFNAFSNYTDRSVCQNLLKFYFAEFKIFSRYF